MRSKRHNTTVQFIDRDSYGRLCVLAVVWGKTIGDTIAQLIDGADARERSALRKEETK